MHHLICWLAAFYCLFEPTSRKHGTVITLILQTNEISTPFFHIFNEYKYAWAGFCFLFSFFLERIVINSWYALPYWWSVVLKNIGNRPRFFRDNLEALMLLNALFFFVLQWYWWVKIVQKFSRLLNQHFETKKKKN